MFIFTMAIMQVLSEFKMMEGTQKADEFIRITSGKH